MNRRHILTGLLLIAAMGGCESKADKTAKLIADLGDADQQVIFKAMAELEELGADAVEPLVLAIGTSDDRMVQFNGLSVLGGIAQKHPEAQTAIDALLSSKPELVKTARAMGINVAAAAAPKQRESPAEDPLLKEGETLGQWVERKAISVTTAETPQFEGVPAEAIELKDRGLKLVFEENRLPDGVKLIEQALAIDPRLPDAYNALLLYYSLGLKDHDAGIAWMTKGVAACPTVAGRHFDLGSAYSQAGRHTDAAAAFTQAIELGINNASVWYNLGNAHARGGKPAEAVPHYRQALERDADHRRARQNLISALYKSGDPSAALKEAGAYLERYPTGENAAWANEAIRRLSQ
jgi:tetratricopeptide (TPR) repeat protein